MGIDPKQQRALRAGRGRPEDRPRDTSREAVRRQEAEPPVRRRERSRGTTAAVAGVQVNLEAGTPVERLARQMGAEPIPEAGPQRKKSDTRDDRGGERGNGTDRTGTEATPRAGTTRGRVDQGAPVTPDEAERTLRARREHSKGDGNVPAAEPHAGLLDERSRDRMPGDLPKARDDRSAPKGNVVAGQEARNPALDVRDDFTSTRPQPRSGFAEARDAALRATAPPPPRRPARPTARRSSAAKRKASTPSRPRRPPVGVRRAPQDAARAARSASLAGKPQAGKRRTGNAPRGDAVSRAARGSVPARRASKARISRAKRRGARG